MDVVIGGNRVGSGERMHTDLNEYNRSTHNLSKKWRSSMGCGMLVPCYRRIMMRGDIFNINIAADCRTIPAKGALFGSYKMQIDFFAVPLRLYQGILHNNPLNIGLRMNQVKLPKLRIFENHVKNGGELDAKWEKYKSEGKMGNSSLMKYLGLSGIGQLDYDEDTGGYYRDVDACKVLAYYDIYKNYYANKQEEKGYVIGGNSTTQPFDSIEVEDGEYSINNGSAATGYVNGIEGIDSEEFLGLQVVYDNTDTNYVKQGYATLYYYSSGVSIPIEQETTWEDIKTYSKGVNVSINNANVLITRNSGDFAEYWTYKGYLVTGINVARGRNIEGKNGVTIREFNLSNIDDMRYALLCFNELGRTATIYDGSDDFDITPYSWLTEKDFYYTDENTTTYTSNKYGCYGLALKTYQNDLFNNWLNTEWIEGENGVNEMSRISTSAGYITIDAISFRTKQYMLLNRVAVCGNSYEDWQDAVYEKIKSHHIETPMFIGGMSKEIVFDEVVQTAPAEIAGEDSYLGKLGGRGRAVEGQNGGHIVYKAEEPSIIMGIVSLTPRINYTQGNDFEMTEIDSIDDLHKPAYDGIGFQDLVGERLAWFDTKLNTSGVVQHRSKIGKVPAWIEYMTDVDEAFGDFAETEGEQGGYMVLNRNYEMDEDGYIKDATTYIDPEKYNYAFAYTALDAQNFWVEIHFNVEARRIMSARIMPNV